MGQPDRRAVGREPACHRKEGPSGLRLRAAEAARPRADHHPPRGRTRSRSSPTSSTSICFERLLEEGRGAARRGRAGGRSEGCGTRSPVARAAALQLAFEPFVQVEVARLKELRLLPSRNESRPTSPGPAADVGRARGAGRPASAAGAASGQLMVALYRSGRQAEALEAYREARRATLVEELGIEPGQGAEGGWSKRSSTRIPRWTAAAPRHRGRGALPDGDRGAEARTVLFADLGPIRISRPTRSGCATSSNARAKRWTRSWRRPAPGSSGPWGTRCSPPSGAGGQGGPRRARAPRGARRPQPAGGALRRRALPADRRRERRGRDRAGRPADRGSRSWRRGGSPAAPAAARSRRVERDGRRARRLRADARNGARLLVRSLAWFGRAGCVGCGRSFVGREGELELLRVTYDRVVRRTSRSS